MNLKSLIRRIFPGIVNLRNRLYNARAHKHFKGKELDKVFTSIYEANHWNDSESASGTGSSLKQAEQVIKHLEYVLHKYNIQSLLDVPCGDFNWMKNVDLRKIQYTGADIVNELIVRNSARYGSDERNFIAADLTNASLPKVDLIFCRDCLVHLSYEHALTAIEHIKKSKSTYLMTTTFPEKTNRDIVSGNWRPVNLELPPFNFPKPLHVFNEGFKEDIRFSDKSLAVWRIEPL